MTYVDACRAPYRGMLMCHMLADTPEELHAMADRIGIRRKWFQGDHYDICLAKRLMALRAGAVEVEVREIVAIRKRWRASQQAMGQKGE
jgi:hypothetical protein